MDFETSYCYPDNNASCIKILRKPEILNFMYIFSATLILITIFGNLFVIITVSHFKQLHTPTNFLVLSLAVSDFLSGFIVMPGEFALTMNNCWYFGTEFCPYYTTYAYLLPFVSSLHLMGISVDRYFAVCNPFYYSINVTNLRTGICIVCMWLFASLYTYIFIFQSGGLLTTDMCVGGCFFSHYAYWWIVHNLLTYLLPMMVIICLYTKIFITARRHAKAIKCVMKESQFPDERKNKLSKSSERKAARTLGIVVITFIILCSPFLVFFLILMFFSVNIANLLSIQTALLYLVAMNCTIDPIIYGLFYPWFRKSLKMMVTLEIFKSSSSVTNLFST